MLRRGSKVGHGPLAGRGSRLRRFLRACDGIALVEFALVAPLLGFLLLGGIEVGRYVLLNQKLNRAAISTSDLVSQAPVALIQDIDQVFAAVGQTMQPFALGAKGIVFITSVSSEDNPAAIPRVDWQLSGSGTASHVSQVGSSSPGMGPPANLPNGFTLDQNQNIIIVELFYDYQPFIFGGVVEAKTIRQVALHRPRMVALNDLKP